MGWFADTSAIGASIGCFFTSAAIDATMMKRDGDGNAKLKLLAVVGICFSIAFIILQLIPILGWTGVHSCKQSYIMLPIWIALGIAFYLSQREKFEGR